MFFTVFDREKQREADCSHIVQNESWASVLLYQGTPQFLLGANGGLYISAGAIIIPCDPARFLVVKSKPGWSIISRADAEAIRQPTPALICNLLPVERGKPPRWGLLGCGAQDMGGYGVEWLPIHANPATLKRG